MLRISCGMQQDDASIAGTRAAAVNRPWELPPLLPRLLLLLRLRLAVPLFCSTCTPSCFGAGWISLSIVSSRKSRDATRSRTAIRFCAALACAAPVTPKLVYLLQPIQISHAGPDACKAERQDITAHVGSTTVLQASVCGCTSLQGLKAHVLMTGFATRTLGTAEQDRDCISAENANPYIQVAGCVIIVVRARPCVMSKSAENSGQR